MFVVDLPMRPRNFAGFTLGCVIVIDSDRCQHERENILSHELNHVEQYKALGLFIVLAPIFIDIEGYSGGSIEERNSLMWSPPEGWIDLWHFLCVPIIPFVFILWSI